MTEEKEFESYSGPASLSPIPLSVGSVPIKPEDKGKIRANAVEAMHHYAQQEMDMARENSILRVALREVQEASNWAYGSIAEKLGGGNVPDR